MAISDKFSDAADQAKDKIGDKDERDRRIDQAGDAIDTKTEGRFADTVDRAQDAARKGGDQVPNRNGQNRNGQNRSGQNRNNNRKPNNNR